MWSRAIFSPSERDTRSEIASRSPFATLDRYPCPHNSASRSGRESQIARRKVEREDREQGAGPRRTLAVGRWAAGLDAIMLAPSRELSARTGQPHPAANPSNCCKKGCGSPNTVISRSHCSPAAESGSIRVATIAVTWGAATADDLAGAGPTAVVSNVAELAAQLLSDAR